jgi:tRNA threonylcarbamoyladenosine biosynthesis protein TsaB
MALILNIETSSENCSVSIAENGIVFGSLQSSETKSHASILTVLIDELLLKHSVGFNQLNAIAVSKGPGSYTGLRIGVSVAKGLCYGANKPLIAINTLRSMVAGLKKDMTDFEDKFPDDAVFCPMLDARRMEVYMATFAKSGEMLKSTSAEIMDETSFDEVLNKHQVIFFGSGADKCKGIIKHPNAVFIEGFQVKADYMALLAEESFRKSKFENVAYFEPFYLKDFVATLPKRKVI